MYVFYFNNLNWWLIICKLFDFRIMENWFKSFEIVFNSNEFFMSRIESFFFLSERFVINLCIIVKNNGVIGKIISIWIDYLVVG